MNLHVHLISDTSTIVSSKINDPVPSYPWFELNWCMTACISVFMNQEKNLVCSQILSFTNKILQVISGHLGWVRSIAFDPGNEWFCTGSADRTIKVLETEIYVINLLSLDFYSIPFY